MPSADQKIFRNSYKTGNRWDQNDKEEKNHSPKMYTKKRIPPFSTMKIESVFQKEIHTQKISHNSDDSGQ